MTDTNAFEWPDPADKVVVAVARELVGFIWDIARNTPIVAVEPQR